MTPIPTLAPCPYPGPFGCNPTPVCPYPGPLGCPPTPTSVSVPTLAQITSFSSSAPVGLETVVIAVVVFGLALALLRMWQQARRRDAEV